MNETNRLKEVILKTPWVYQLCKTAQNPEEMRLTIMQLFKDAEKVFEEVRDIDTDFVNWIMLFTLLTKEAGQPYTLTEIANLLRVSRQSVNLYIKEGKLKGEKIGKQWLVNQQSLDRFIEERKKRNI